MLHLQQFSTNHLLDWTWLRLLYFILLYAQKKLICWGILAVVILTLSLVLYFSLRSPSATPAAAEVPKAKQSTLPTLLQSPFVNSTVLWHHVLTTTNILCHDVHSLFLIRNQTYSSAHRLESFSNLQCKTDDFGSAKQVNQTIKSRKTGV
jgi:hypothetical protein